MNFRLGKIFAAGLLLTLPLQKCYARPRLGDVGSVAASQFLALGIIALTKTNKAESYKDYIKRIYSSCATDRVLLAKVMLLHVALGSLSYAISSNCCTQPAAGNQSTGTGTQQSTTQNPPTETQPTDDKPPAPATKPQAPARPPAPNLAPGGQSPKKLETDENGFVKVTAGPTPPPFPGKGAPARPPAPTAEALAKAQERAATGSPKPKFTPPTGQPANAGGMANEAMRRAQEIKERNVALAQAEEARAKRGAPSPEVAGPEKETPASPNIKVDESAIMQAINPEKLAPAREFAARKEAQRKHNSHDGVDQAEWDAEKAKEEAEAEEASNKRLAAAQRRKEEQERIKKEDAAARANKGQQEQESHDATLLPQKTSAMDGDFSRAKAAAAASPLMALDIKAQLTQHRTNLAESVRAGDAGDANKKWIDEESSAEAADGQPQIPMHYDEVEDLAEVAP